MPTDNGSEIAPSDPFPEEEEEILSQELSDATVDNAYRDLLINDIKQRMRFRTVAVRTTLITLVLLGVYAFSAFYHVAHVDTRNYLPWVGLETPTSVVLIVAPIVAVSAITAMLLLGAFRRFKEDDADKIDIKSLAIEALKANGGGGA